MSDEERHSMSWPAFMWNWHLDMTQSHNEFLRAQTRTQSDFLSHQVTLQEVIAKIYAKASIGNDRLHERESDGSYRIVADDALVARILQYWMQTYAIGQGVICDLYFGLCRKFLRQVVFEDIETFRYLQNSSSGVLFMANHQTAVESAIFGIVLGAMEQRPLIALSKVENHDLWIGQLLELASTYPGSNLPESILYMKRENQDTVLEAFQELLNFIVFKGYSALIHVEGTRAVQAGHQVQTMSSTIIDLALKANLPIVPVRFLGGLPIESGPKRLDFPVGFGSLDIFLGRPIFSQNLRNMSLTQRKNVVLDGINRLGSGELFPNPPDYDFQIQVAKQAVLSQLSEEKATLLVALKQISHASPETRRLLDILERTSNISASVSSDPWFKKMVNFFSPTSFNGV